MDCFSFDIGANGKTKKIIFCFSFHSPLSLPNYDDFCF